MRCEKCGKYIVDSSRNTCPYCDADLNGTSWNQERTGQNAVMNTVDKAMAKASKKAMKEASKLDTPLIAPGVFVGFGIVAFVVTSILACHDIPEFIRKIPGEIFLVLLFGIAALVVLFGWICLVITEKLFIQNLAKKTKDMKFFDSDWMRDFPKYYKVGYYVLKGVLHRMLQVESAIINGKTVYSLQKNPEISSDELQQYCKKNPNIKRIIHFLNGGKKSLSEIIRNVGSDDVISSEHHKKFLLELRKFGAIRQICFAFVVTVVMYFACTKLIMGIQHGKAVKLLIFEILVICPFLLMRVHKLFLTTSEKYVKKINSIVYYQQLPNRSKMANLVKMDVTKPQKPEDIDLVLRAYVLWYNNLRSKIRKQKDQSFLRHIFAENDIAWNLFQQASKEMSKKESNNSSTGCGGCSSCGGCSGCGGCGGCGD